jgi:RNA polymerase sigma-70 factor (ECF subfamily)
MEARGDDPPAAMTARLGPLEPEEEQDVMRRLAAGEEEAVRVLYARFGRTVYGMGLRMLGSREAAEELTQDVFVAAWRKAARYDPVRGRLSTWLMAIAHNLAVDRLRRKGVASPPSADLDEVTDQGVTEEEALLDREDARRILASVSTRERRLLALAYLGGWTSREIAEAEGIPLGTVKTRMRTLLMRLRASYGKGAIT